MQALQQAGYNNGEGTTTIPVFGVDATADAVAAIDAGARISLLPVCGLISAMRKTKNGKM